MTPATLRPAVRSAAVRRSLPVCSAAARRSLLACSPAFRRSLLAALAAAIVGCAPSLCPAAPAVPLPPLESFPSRPYVAPPTPPERAAAEALGRARVEKRRAIDDLLTALAAAEGLDPAAITNGPPTARMVGDQVALLRRHREDLDRRVPAGAAGTVGLAAGMAATAAVFLLANRKRIDGEAPRA